MTAEVALEQLVRATKAQMPEIDVRGKLIDAWTCDTAPECLEIALNYDFDPQIWAPRRIGQRLVFSNILDAFSDGARQHVDKYHKHRQSGMEASKEALDTLQNLRACTSCRSSWLCKVLENSSILQAGGLFSNFTCVFLSSS